MSIYNEGDIIKGKTMNLIVMQIDKYPCIKVCEFGNHTCYKTIMCEEIGIKNIACKDLIGNCYFKKLDGGV